MLNCGVREVIIMVQGTTPTFILTLPSDVDLSDATNIYFTVTQRNTSVTKHGSEIQLDGNQVSIFMTQAETLQFSEGSCEVQLNWVYANGERAATKPVTIKVEKNLLKRVIS